MKAPKQGVAYVLSVAYRGASALGCSIMAGLFLYVATKAPNGWNLIGAVTLSLPFALSALWFIRHMLDRTPD